MDVFQRLTQLSCKSIRRHEDDVGYALVMVAKRLCETIDESHENTRGALLVAAEEVVTTADVHFEKQQRSKSRPAA